jgi:hypothetical protein
MSAKLSALGASAPVLTPSLLARLYELNFDYLELALVEHRDARADGPHHLPRNVAQSLAECPIEARRALARTTFSLYALGFEDQHFWRKALHAGERPIEARYRRESPQTFRTSFCELALLHAWHVAVTQPVAARMVYGMPQDVVQRMERARLWQLKRIASDYPELLMPRWPTNPCFWPDMVRFARLGDQRRLSMTQQLGHQLIAAELLACEMPNSPVRQRQSNLLVQRLAARRR